MKISIALTTYNGEKYLTELLNSLIKQSLLPDEIIICDDMSSDNTLNILQTFYNKFSSQIEIKTYINSINLGWRDNFRKALKLCTGDIVFLCDQDDIWALDKIERMSKIMATQNEIGLLASNYSFLIQDDSEIKTLPHEVKGDSGKVVHAFQKKYYGHVMRPGCTFCVKRDLIRRMNDYDLTGYGHDCALWHIALSQNCLWIYEKVLLQQRLHPDHASKSKEPLGIERRISELNRSLKMCEYTYQLFLFNNADTNIPKDMMQYYKKRIELLQNKNIIFSLLYNVINCRKAPSVRSMMGDVAVLLQHKY